MHRGGRRRPVPDRPGRAQRDRGEGPGSRAQRRPQGRRQAGQLRRPARLARAREAAGEAQPGGRPAAAEPQDHRAPADQGDLAAAQVPQPPLQGPPAARERGCRRSGRPSRTRRPPAVPTGPAAAGAPSSRAARRGEQVPARHGQVRQGPGHRRHGDQRLRQHPQGRAGEGRPRDAGRRGCHLRRQRGGHGRLRHRSASRPPESAGSPAPASRSSSATSPASTASRLSGWAYDHAGEAWNFTKDKVSDGAKAAAHTAVEGGKKVLGGAKKVISSLKPGFL